MTGSIIESTSPSGDYEASLHRLASFVKRLRAKPISDSELEVTMDFAGPMTQGGPLFMLIQPLEDHPWSEGTAEVIKQCPTWRSLKEALHICGLYLIADVSALDIRPFLSETSYEILTETQRHELDELVFAAIRNKRPDTLLVLSTGEVRTT
jgi:hypothetical protein